MNNSNSKKPKKFGVKKEKPEFEQRLLDLARVTRVVKGGRRFSFRATMVIGDRKGRVGVGVSKGADVSDAVNKAVNDAKKSLVKINTVETTITHDTCEKIGSARVMLKPAKKGRGIVAGGAVRAVVELAGIKDVVSKSFGSSNKLNVARVTLLALSKLEPAVESKAKPKKEKVATEVKEVEVKETATKKKASPKKETAKKVVKKAPKQAKK